MHQLPVHQARIERASRADEIRHRLAPIVPQSKALAAQPHGGVNHLMTRVRHQVKQHQCVAVTGRHAVSDFAHIKRQQIIRHILGEVKTAHDFAVYHVAAAAADAVVRVVF